MSARSSPSAELRGGARQLVAERLRVALAERVERHGEGRRAALEGRVRIVVGEGDVDVPGLAGPHADDAFLDALQQAAAAELGW